MQGSGAMRLRVVAALLVALSGACGSEDPSEDGRSADEVKVDTRSPEARRQYDANVAFASSYEARCPKTEGRPRVLVTGFGRFLSLPDNATGRIVSTVVPNAPYPESPRPPPGEVDPPEAQLSVGMTTIDVPEVGEVDVCGMILPVYWDLAAILIAKEAESFEPSLVLMNGVASSRQALWIELGSVNRASLLDDGSDQLRPSVRPDERFAKIVDGAPATYGNLLSWRAVQEAARDVVLAHADDVDDDVRFGDIVDGVRLAGFPRYSNTYLCNNVTYVMNHLMSKPNRTVRLLQASKRERGKPNEVKIAIGKDLRAVPRVFVHWPSDLADKHHAAAAEVMVAMIGAQLTAPARGEAATAGDNDLADPSLPGGEFY